MLLNILLEWELFTWWGRSFGLRPQDDVSFCHSEAMKWLKNLRSFGLRPQDDEREVFRRKVYLTEGVDDF